MERIFIASSLLLSITIVFCMIRAIKGPLAADRLIAVNVIGTKTIILISLISFVLEETYFIDVVLVYALISFIGSIGIADLIDK
ncbi:monovalent cation/H+ antiporter complex subunit F [Tepidibacter mesophilus]|uniref:monovalent cation/H+ antiporter complex subunit F n=1 Tax=Tepidibacter mesophilus TaxID=655607 RepID=UPI000C06CFAE|nr:monovalent cation/H+ antiporter complex subunit F [Tepidibacter mesophilus]